jgi:molecular chaperone GrpE
MDEKNAAEKAQSVSSPQDTGPSESETPDLAQQLSLKEEELRAAQEKIVRLAADLENFKKRIEREKVEYMRFALESFAAELFPFLDNLERAISAAKESMDLDKLIEGLELTLSGYCRTLEHFGMKAFAAEGQGFDPGMHEALTVEETGECDENMVVKCLRKGYTLHEKVIRPALVVVAKRPDGGSGQDESNA